MDMDEVNLHDALATGSDLGNKSGEKTISTKEMENEIKELGIAFKALAAIVNEALIQNKARNHHVDEIQTTLVNIQQTIGQRGLLNSTSDLTNPKDAATATKVSQSVSPDTIIPTDILKTLDAVKNIVVNLSDDDDTTDEKRKNKGHEPGDKADVHWGGKFNTSNKPSPTQSLVSAFRKENHLKLLRN
ncbi:uncharacterized protein LOC130741055 [Lotus japonicus]|uniref:uncharacterized protein LOC130741055 n=1 Tax=Lotus japonicus TaxID=34305 RepID=UPI0025865049|nr:uncharacterized protein LOC130741055 [Lotus japonicus]XP_057449814.1 uncharacterized protein LOC130741055 [Lotus japonicus]